MHRDPGTDWTARCAAHNGQPLLICDPADPLAGERIIDWFGTHQICTLNVAGPSELTSPGIDRPTSALLRQVFSRPSARRGTFE